MIACSDHWTVEVTRLGGSLGERFRVCLPEAQVLSRFVNKAGFAELVKTAKVPHPFTEIPRSEEDVIELSRRFDGQLFLKPANSQRFQTTFGAKAFRIESTEQALSIFRRVREGGLDVMVQEYVPGPSDRHYFVDGFVDRNHLLCACFARRRLRMFPPDFGNSSYMVSVGLEDVAGAVQALETLFEAAGYRGIFSAEFKLDERDRQFKILEVNCRPWWYVQFAAECGVDVVEMAYCDALGMPFPTAKTYKTGVRLVFPYYDFHALQEMRRRGKPVLKEFLSSWIGAKSPLFSWDDPLPAVSDFADRVVKKLSLR